MLSFKISLHFSMKKGKNKTNLGVYSVNHSSVCLIMSHHYRGKVSLPASYLIFHSCYIYCYLTSPVLRYNT